MAMPLAKDPFPACKYSGGEVIAKNQSHPQKTQKVASN